MLTIKFTERGYECSQEISIGLFHQTGNTLIKVVCEIPYYGEPESLEDEICIYMNTFLSEATIQTNHVTLELSTGTDMQGNYVSSLIFQVYI